MSECSVHASVCNFCDGGLLLLLVCVCVCVCVCVLFPGCCCFGGVWSQSLWLQGVTVNTISSSMGIISYLSEISFFQNLKDILVSWNMSQHCLLFFICLNWWRCMFSQECWCKYLLCVFWVFYTILCASTCLSLPLSLSRTHTQLEGEKQNWDRVQDVYSWHHLLSKTQKQQNCRNTSFCKYQFKKKKKSRLKQIKLN